MFTILDICRSKGDDAVMRFDREKLRVERERQGYSYRQLAAKIAVFEPKAAQTHVWGWERGVFEPTLRYLTAMAKVLGKPIEYFMKK